MPSGDQDDDSQSYCHGKSFYLATKLRNIMKHPETQFEH